MIRVVILLAAISPPLFILSYGIAKARSSWNSEAVWNAFFVGAVSAIAAMACEYALDYVLPLDRLNPFVGSATKAAFIAAIPEESIKFFVLLSLAEKHVDVRRLQDTIVLALAVSLGFATLENFFYLISAGDWKITAATRAISSVPGHGIDGLAMGALLIAARLKGNGPSRHFIYVLIVPIILHAAYDFPLFAIEKNLDKIWFGAAWIAVIALSSLLVIALCNRIIPKAVERDRALGRDGTSVETTDRLIVGGVAAIIAGPGIAVLGFYAKGLDVALVSTILSVFPIALGIDSIFTGFKRRKARLGAGRSNFDYAH
jgi:RsiW-degrading membrane proteinase PrsW (M82 family)